MYMFMITEDRYVNYELKHHPLKCNLYHTHYHTIIIILYIDIKL